MIGDRLKRSFTIWVKGSKKWVKVIFLGLIVIKLSACNPLQSDDTVNSEGKIKSNAAQFIDELNLDNEQKALLYFYAQSIENIVALDTNDNLEIEKSGSDMLLVAECSIDYFEDLSDVLRYTDNIRTKILDTDAKREQYIMIENSDEVAMASPHIDINCDDVILAYSKK